ncbi:MAG TPA: hypothetical protein VIS52_01680 [Motiliproteus sp.]
MSNTTDRKYQISALAMRTYPHMDGCPCADHGRHFELTPQHQEYLVMRHQRSAVRSTAHEE